MANKPTQDNELEAMVRDFTKVHPLAKSEVRRRLITWRDVRVVEAKREAFGYSKAAIIAAPILISGQRTVGTPSCMPWVLDKQIGSQEAGKKTLPIVINTYALRDFALGEINDQLAALTEKEQDNAA